MKKFKKITFNCHTVTANKLDTLEEKEAKTRLVDRTVIINELLAYALKNIK